MFIFQASGLWQLMNWTYFLTKKQNARFTDEMYTGLDVNVRVNLLFQSYKENMPSFLWAGCHGNAAGSSSFSHQWASEIVTPGNLACCLGDQRLCAPAQTKSCFCLARALNSEQKKKAPNKSQGEEEYGIKN